MQVVALPAITVNLRSGIVRELTTPSLAPAPIGVAALHLAQGLTSHPLCIIGLVVPQLLTVAATGDYQAGSQRFIAPKGNLLLPNPSVLRLFAFPRLLNLSSTHRQIVTHQRHNCRPSSLPMSGLKRPRSGQLTEAVDASTGIVLLMSTVCPGSRWHSMHTC